MQVATPTQPLPSAGPAPGLGSAALVTLALTPLLLLAALAPGEDGPSRALGLVALTAALVGGQLLTLRRLAEARRVASEADRLARVDPLTGLGNRRALAEDLERETRRALRTGRPAALLMLDLDGFKQVNDLLGHAHGDLVLQAFAATVAAQTRGELDSVYRYGGDEFVVLLPEASVSAARAVGHRIEAAFTSAARRLAPGLPLGCSVGVAPLDHRAPADWLGRADDHMYAMKQRDHRPSPP